jgi:GH25 family lysozyme M1 (1,4-beta-N-acetylmuramidase)
MKRKLVTLFLCLFCTTLAFGDITQWMTDMSSHNAGVDVKRGMTFAGNSKIEMIIHRITIGRYNNPSDADKLFSKRAFETYNEGIHFGAYHVAYPSSEAKNQAQGYIKAIRELYIPGQKIILSIDWEYTCVKWNYGEDGKKKTCAKEGIVPPSFVVEFAKEVERLTGKKVIIYTGSYVLKEFRKYFNSTPSIVSDLQQYPLWIARYQGKAAYSFPTEEEIYPWYDWTFWQFAGGEGNGPTKRISPKIQNFPIDTNFFNGSREEIDNFVKEYGWVVN